jgi:hypothetical protein
MANHIKLIPQKQKLTVSNFDVASGDNKNVIRHSALLPNNIRCLIVGRSNSGKSNVLLTLIEHPLGLKFYNIYLYSNSLHQAKYEYLKKMVQHVKEIGYFTFSTNKDLVSVKDAKQNSLVIFDDIGCDTESMIREYFTFGRHYNLDCFYLTQSYSKICKQFIRDNANLLVIFKQDLLNVHLIYRDHVGTDLTFKEFERICKLCWDKEYSFLVINKECKLNEGRYRKCFDNFFQI